MKTHRGAEGGSGVDLSSSIRLRFLADSVPSAAFRFFPTVPGLPTGSFPAILPDFLAWSISMS
jgi:hypothetical protein